MASKIQSHHVYVAITPYKVDGSSAEEFNELDVMTAYDDRRHHFYVCLHAGWKSSYGSHGCIIMGGDDPLTAPKYVIVKDAPRNSQKTIDEIGAAMEMAKDAIAWLFDKRDWQRLYVAVRNIALNGYTEKYRQQMEQLMNNTNNQNSEDNTMRLNMNANKSENQNVAMEPQVNNASSSESRAESHSSYAESQEGSAKANNPIEDAQAVEVTTEADVAEVDDIVPKVTPSRPSRGEEKPAVTMPLGKHGTLVIAGVGGTKKEEPKANSQKPEAKVQDSVAATGKLTYQTYEKTKVNKTTGKPYTVTHAKIMGFAATDEAYQRGVELHGAASGEMVDGVKVLGLYFSHRYAAAAKLVCDALNEGKPFAECVAIIDNATEENARKREEWKAKIEERKQKREERKAKMKEDGRRKMEEPATAQAGYSDQDVADMLRKVMAGGDVPENIKKLLQAA